MDNWRFYRDNVDDLFIAFNVLVLNDRCPAKQFEKCGFYYRLLIM